MSGINLSYPNVLTASLLICDTVNNTKGSSDGIPSLTKSGLQTVSAALEIQSTEGALLLPRLTNAERDASTFIPLGGMTIYNTDSDSFQLYITGTGWIDISQGNGDVVGPAVSVANDIATFADTTGKLLQDSGVPITKVPTLLRELRRAPLALVNQIGNLGHIQFVNDIGLVFVDSLMPVEFITNDFGPDSQVCSLFTGGLPSSSTTPSALVEIQSTTGALLISRMTTAQMNALTSPEDGMIIYNINDGQFTFREAGSWVVFSNSGGVAPGDATYIIQKTNAELPNAQSLGDLTNGLLKNFVTDINGGVLSIATPGVDYYAPNFPTILQDDGSNVFVGLTAGGSVSSGTNNTGMGTACLQALTTGIQNTAYGTGAMTVMVTGNNNCAAGYAALANAANSSFNTAFGSLALQNNTSGNDNVAIGYNTGAGRTNLTRCVLIGSGANSTVDNLQNSVAIGYNASVSLNNAMVLGNGCVVGMGTNSPTTSANNPNNILHIVGGFQQKGVKNSWTGSDVLRIQAAASIGISGTSSIPNGSFTFPTSYNSSVLMRVSISVITTDGADSAYASSVASAYYNGTTLQAVGALPTITFTSTAGISVSASWQILAFSINQFFIQLNGDASKSTNWVAVFEIFSTPATVF